MKVLYVTPYVPSRIRTRSYHLIRALSGLGHSVLLLAACGGTEAEWAEAQELRQWGVEVELVTVSRLRSLGNCLWALPTGEPLQALYAYHPELVQRVGELAREEGCDVVHIEHLRAARLVRAVSGVPAVYDSVDCISLLFEQTLRIAPQLRSRLMAWLDLGRTRRYEARLLGQYDRVVVTSQRDKEALEELARRYLRPPARPAPVTVVTNGVDLDYFRPGELPLTREPHMVVMTGKMSYHANMTGALFFARVLPRIWATNPAVRFFIVGKEPPEVVRKLAQDERIVVTGMVSDLRPYLARASVAVCPVPYAAGVQNKALEAMAMGTPVICTPAAFSGLQAQAGEVLVAEGEAKWAAAVLRLLSDAAMAEELGAAGRRYVERCHSWQAQARELVRVYEESKKERRNDRK